MSAAPGGDELKAEPIAVREDERGWEALRGDSAARPGVLYKTLISGRVTHSESLTSGGAKIPSGVAPSKRDLTLLQLAIPRARGFPTGVVRRVLA